MTSYINCDELAVRIGEACMGNKRPNGMTAREAFDDLRRFEPNVAAGFMRAARAAAEYVAECCNAVNPGSVEVKTVTIETHQKQ